jgi:hypothetical protein
MYVSLHRWAWSFSGVHQRFLHAPGQHQASIFLLGPAISATACDSVGAMLHLCSPLVIAVAAGRKHVACFCEVQSQPANHLVSFLIHLVCV